ncbi:MAG TPA: sialidase family protein [Actinomycetota bacterium]
MRRPLRIVLLLIASLALLLVVPAKTLREPALEPGRSATPSGAVQISDRSEVRHCRADGRMRGLNYPNTEVEPYGAVNPRDPSNIVATWQQDRWSNGGARTMPVARSTDGGATWDLVEAPDGPRITLCSSGTKANKADYQRASDPWLSFAPNGDLYQTSLSFNQKNAASAVLVSKSTDGGATWSDPVVIRSDPTAFNDKESITADPRTPPDGRRSAAYVVWTRDGKAWFSKTTDGISWRKARPILKEGFSVAHQIEVHRSGRLIDVFSLFKSKGRNYIAVMHSKDAGASPGDRWSRPILISKFSFVPARDPDTGQKLRSGEALPDIATDQKTGALYVAWQDLVFKANGKRYSGIFFSMSRDGGERWSKPVRINQPSAALADPNDQAFIPALHVASDGTVGVSYYDFRQNTDAESVSTDYWLARCTGRSQPCTDRQSWSEEHVAGPFDMEMAPTSSHGLFLGDYMTTTGAGRDFALFFVQSTVFTGNRTNVYFRQM